MDGLLRWNGGQAKATVSRRRTADSERESISSQRTRWPRPNMLRMSYRCLPTNRVPDERPARHRRFIPYLGLTCETDASRGVQDSHVRRHIPDSEIGARQAA